MTTQTQLEITFSQRQRHQPHWSGKYNGEVDYMDTYFTMNGKTHFLRGEVIDAPDYEKREMEGLKAQLIDNHGKFIRYYCHAPIDNPTPLDMIAWLVENGLRWEDFTEFNFYKHGKAWEFGGNTMEYSAAFQFRIYDRSLAIKTKRAFIESQDPTFIDRHNQRKERVRR